jgi:serine phosphatase RsbU (regulator of sigma subunit)
MNIRKDGHELWVQTTITPILDLNNNIQKLVAIDSDITALKETENQLQKQKMIAESQRDKIEEINNEINSSIKYASHIQNSILTPGSNFNEIFGEHFIIFKPRNIVSGDFYWVKKLKDKTSGNGIGIIAVADCTGHGIPGAFLSMLGISLLNEIVNDLFEEFQLSLKANEVMNQLRLKLINTLHQTGKEDDSHDGMDISLLAINTDTHVATWAGANNPLWIIKSHAYRQADQKGESVKLKVESNTEFDTFNLRNFELYELKGDKMPVGISSKIDSKPFTLHELSFSKGDCIYMFTDGFADQFGGNFINTSHERKYTYSKFKNLILENASIEMAAQAAIINKDLNDWMNPDSNISHPQIDDITIIGMRI